MRKLACLGLIILIFVLAACGQSRTALTANEFVAKMEAAGFDIVDAKDQFEEGVVEAVFIALNDNYQIEFYVVPSVSQAESAFEQNKSNFEAASGGSSSHKYVSMKNYSYFFQTASDTYYAVSRIDNTFIYVMADAAYKKEIGDIISDLGY